MLLAGTSLGIAFRTPRPRCAALLCVLLCALSALALPAHAQQPAPDTPQQQPAPANPSPAPTSPATLSPATTPAPADQAAPAPVAPPAAPPAQATAPVPDATQSAPPAPAQPEPAQPQQAQPNPAQPGPVPVPEGPITEEALKQQLVGKQFYLRGGYLGDTLAFDEHGKITGHSPQGSYTLSVIQIDRVRLTKHKVDMEGARYGLHFNEQLAYEDASSAYDKVRITPKKKVVRISIDRELVVNPKKKKEPSPKELAKEKAKAAKPAATAKTPTAPAPPAASAASAPAQPEAPAATPAPETAAAAPVPDAPGPGAPAPGIPAPTSPAPTVPAATAPPASTAAAPPATAPTPASPDAEPSEADQLKASIAATPEAERPADPNSVTTTTSQAHANQLLRTAIDNILAAGLDDRMRAAMPDFWKLYYQSVAAKADYRPADPAVLRQNTVDQKARLLTSFEPDSNDFAQEAGVAGMALYHTVIGPDGKPGEIAVARPIGFGLDENAVAAIRKAKFSPAIKNGQPVPVMLDLVVQFRIFSRRTGATGPLPDLAKQAAPPPNSQQSSDKAADAPNLPGPYSVPHPASPNN